MPAADFQLPQDCPRHIPILMISRQIQFETHRRDRPGSASWYWVRSAASVPRGLPFI
jgi:hypothetical protein